MLSIEGLVKRYGGVDALRGVTLELAEGGLFTLLGPSGCGKTTTLRCVAGLERADDGVVTLAGTVVEDARAGLHIPPARRGVGMVFQVPAVWPHMTVADNVAFPLLARPRQGRPGRREIAGRVGELLELVRLEGLGNRPATDLSGGQQQRLSLARALVARPRLLLLDEPLSALDARLRVEIRDELQRIQHELGVTTLYVTHDQAEALALSSRIGVMREGAIVQVGSPEEVYGRPATPFVARFVGAANLLPGTVAGSENGTVVVRTAHGQLRVAHDARVSPGAEVLVVARPEHVRLDANGAGRVVTRAFLGDSVELVVAVGGEQLRARVDPVGAPPPGAPVGVHFDAQRLSIVAREPRAG